MLPRPSFFRGRWARALSCSLALTAPLVSSAASGTPISARTQETQEAMAFNLPAQPAAQALLTFSKQTRIAVLFPYDALQRVKSSEVVGRFRPTDALHRLLQGTGYQANPSGPDRFVVVVAAKPVGQVKGRLVTPEGSGLAGVRVAIPFTRHSTLTDANGEFEFSALPPGNYRFFAQASAIQATQIPGARVEADQRVTLAPHTVGPAATDPSLLAPFLVKDRATRRDPFDRSEAQLGPRTVGGNLDLARTENDALPFTIYNRDQIGRSGVVSLNEFLQRELLDADSVMRPPEQDGMQPTFAAGSTNLNLRGFGADQTIILVNGRRLPEALTSGSASQTPDVNFIPLSLVQQVEVLPVSAASLYSGNAVGGVINIVLRPGVDAEATEVALTYTNAMDSYDAPQSSASVLHSRSLLRGALRVRFNASVTKALPPTETELGFHQAHSPRAIAPHVSLYRATPNVRGAQLLSDDGSGTASPPQPLFGAGSASVTSVPPGTNGTGGLAAFRGREGKRNFDYFDSPGGFATSFDSVDYPYGRTQQRSAFFASVVFDATPWLQLGFDGTYTRTVLHRGYDVMAADLRLRAESPFNPFGREAIVSLNEMAPALGENHSEARLEFGSGVLSALILLPRGWRLLLDGQYGRNLAKYRGLAGADYARWQQLVDQGLYNPLRDTQVFGPPQAFYDRVLIHRGGVGRFVTLGDYSTLDAAARLSNHELNLPTGRGVVNVGIDYRQNALGRYNDERVFADGTLASPPVRYIGRTLERYSFFTEVQSSLLPKAWLPRAVRSLETDTAVRYIASNQDNEITVAPTFALKAQLPAGVALRASVSTSSRYPTPQMSRTALPPSSTPGSTVGLDLRPVFDPLQNEKYSVQEEAILNPALVPEETLTQTAGVMFRTGRTHRFRASIDFVDTRKVNEVVGLDVQDILNLEHLFPERVIRAPTSAEDPKGVGLVSTVVTGAINARSRRSHHWSTALDYAWTDALGGTLELYGRLVNFSRYERLLVAGANVVNEIDAPEGGASNLLKYRSKFGGSWSTRHHGFGLDGHYFHSRILPVKERQSHGRDRISPYWQFDAFAHTDLSGWLPWAPPSLRLQVRVNNVFSEPFPRYTNDPYGAGVQTYGDWRGRVYSLSLTSTF